MQREKERERVGLGAVGMPIPTQKREKKRATTKKSITQWSQTFNLTTVGTDGVGP